MARMDPVGFSFPQSLLDRIDRDRSARNFLDGESMNRSEWLREAAREKLERDGYEKRAEAVETEAEA